MERMVNQNISHEEAADFKYYEVSLFFNTLVLRTKLTLPVDVYYRTRATTTARGASAACSRCGSSAPRR